MSSLHRSSPDSFQANDSYDRSMPRRALPRPPSLFEHEREIEDARTPPGARPMLPFEQSRFTNLSSDSFSPREHRLQSAGPRTSHRREGSQPSLPIRASRRSQQFLNPSNGPPARMIHGRTYSDAESHPNSRVLSNQQFSHSSSFHEENQSVDSYEHENEHLGYRPGEQGPDLIRSTTRGRHPHSRPLPGPPKNIAESRRYEDSESDLESEPEVEELGLNVDTRHQTPITYDDLMDEVEAAVLDQRLEIGHEYDDQYLSDQEYEEHSEQEYGDQEIFQPQASPRSMHTGTQRLSDHVQSSYDSRAFEATRGDIGEQDFGPATSDSMHGLTADLDTYSGGFFAGYRGEHDIQGQGSLTTLASQEPSIGNLRPNLEPTLGLSSQGKRDDCLRDANLHESSSLLPASVDTLYTGGLSDPSLHHARLRSIDNGGDDTWLSEEINTSDLAAAQVPFATLGEYPGRRKSAVLFGRPLPAAPVDLDNYYGDDVSQSGPAVASQMPATLTSLRDVHHRDGQGLVSANSLPDVLLPRSSSLTGAFSQANSAQVVRSKTEADKMKHMPGQRNVSGRILQHEVRNSDDGDVWKDLSSSVLDLPVIPIGKRRKFNASKLDQQDFDRCAEPWALSSIHAWLLAITKGELDLKEVAIQEAVVLLFTNKVPTMYTTDAENLGQRFLDSMYRHGGLIKDEEWVRLGTSNINGVLFQLTTAGCYSSRAHIGTMSGRCYSYHCMRTLKKINLHDQALEPHRKMEDWVTFYRLKKEDLEGRDRKEVERQHNLHEIVTTEDTYLDQLNVLQVLYRDGLIHCQPAIISPNRRESFLRDVFGTVDAVKHANEEHLLAQLKYRQNEQGPWVKGFSDIFREWIRKAKGAYVAYAANFPNASFQVRQEAGRNVLFQQFLDQMREHERSRRLGWDTFLKAPITRLQRYGLLLATVDKHMMEGSEEKLNLKIAMEEIKAVTLECDARVADMSKHVDLTDLASKLKLRSEMANVQLNLTHLGREVIHRGDLQRLGSTKFTWVDAHLILFDHYLVLAKRTDDRHSSSASGGESYDVSKPPIPMDLLILESVDDDPVVRSSMKGLVPLTSITPRSGTAGNNGADMKHHDSAASTSQINAPPNRSMSMATLPHTRDDKIMYPFRVRHLGRADVYVLYASSNSSRQEWCTKIVLAKTRHAESLHRQNAEPFSIRLIADTAFACDSSAGLGKAIMIRGTPLDRAIRQARRSLPPTAAPPSPICRAAVNCATTFTDPLGTVMVAVGTDFGLYVAEAGNPLGWSRVISASHITQIAVLEDFSLLLVLNDKQLIAHHLETVLLQSRGGINQSGNSGQESSSRRAPQRLSGAKEIGFFAHGRIKDRHLIFYKKREGVSSIFKILEPIYQRSASLTDHSTIRSRLGGMLGRKGTTEFFRDFDEFYIASETYALNLFHSSMAVSSTRGIEVLNLEKKQPFTVPDARSAEASSMAARIKDQRPLGMFRLSENEFLVIHETAGLYVNKHGEVSRSVILDFIGRAKNACLVAATYLVLIGHTGLYAEVRNAINGRLRQIISGRDIRLLDSGDGQLGSVKLCMQHPEIDRAQLIIELLPIEGQREPQG